MHPVAVDVLFIVIYGQVPLYFVLDLVCKQAPDTENNPMKKIQPKQIPIDQPFSKSSQSNALSAEEIRKKTRSEQDYIAYINRNRRKKR